MSHTEMGQSRKISRVGGHRSGEIARAEGQRQRKIALAEGQTIMKGEIVEKTMYIACINIVKNLNYWKGLKAASADRRENYNIHQKILEGLICIRKEFPFGMRGMEDSIK